MYWKAWRPNIETKICKMWLPPWSDGFHCCTFVLFLCVSHSTWHQEARPCKTCGCGIPSMQNALPLTRLDSLCNKDRWKRDSLASLFWIVFKNLTETKKILCRWSVISFVYKNRDVLGLTLGREWFVTGLCSFITYVCKGHGFFFQGWGNSAKWEDIFGKLFLQKKCQVPVPSQIQNYGQNLSKAVKYLWSYSFVYNGVILSILVWILRAQSIYCLFSFFFFFCLSKWFITFFFRHLDPLTHPLLDHWLTVEFTSDYVLS